LKKIQQIAEYDDLNTIEISEDVFAIVNLIVNQIIIPPLSCKLSHPNEEGKVVSMIINNENYFFTNTLNIIMLTFQQYKDIVIQFPQLAERSIASAKEILLLYTSLCRKYYTKSLRHTADNRG